MKLLSYPDILNSFQKNIERSIKVDLAIAWVTHSSALEMLTEQVKERPLSIRALVGVDTNFTVPRALEALQKIGDVKVIKNKKGIFHPKMYIFHMEKTAVVWIGSANFTNSGLSENEELVAEIEIQNDDAITWFEEKWGSISQKDSDLLLKNFIEQWPSWPNLKLIKNKNDETPTDFNLTCDWKDYLRQLKEYDRYWIDCTQNSDVEFSVLGDSNSYLSVISDGFLLTRRDSWDNLSQQDADMLLGLTDKFGCHGLLGSMKGAGNAQHIFKHTDKKTLKIRNSILTAIHKVINANENNFDIVLKLAIEEITSYKGVAMGVATRLLALARPDAIISLNKGSREELGKLADLAPSTLSNFDNYLRLLQWMREQEWYNSPQPSDMLEKSIWNKRAALLDAFVYEW